MSKPTDIELSVGLSVDDVAKSTAKLSNEIKNIFDKSAGKKLDISLQRIKKSMSDVFSETNKIIERMAELEGMQIPTADYQLLEKRIDIATKSLEKFQQMQKNLSDKGITSGSAWDLIQSNIDQLTDELKEAEVEMNRLVETGSAFTLGEDTQEYADLTDKLGQMNNKMRLGIMQWNEATGAAAKFKVILSGVTKVLSTIGRSIKSVFSTVINVFKKGIMAARKFVSAIAAIPSHFQRASKASNNFNGNLKRGITSLLRYGLGIASIATLFNKLRSAMSEGVKNIVLWEGENGKLNNSISSLLSALSTLKNSIGAMAAPLINSLAPAITRIIELINVAIQKISMFVAALTGQKTFLTANKVQENYAASLDKTGKSAKKAAKELKGYLSPLDEINKFQKQDEDAGGGAGGGGASAGFTETPIDPKMLDLIQKLKDMWNDKDFTKLGTELGERLKKALDSIPWDRIRKTSNDLGKCLATLINGFVEVQGLGYSIGTTVAQTVNTIFEFVNGLVHNLHWDSIGKFIGDTFNGFFENIDWDLIYDTVVTGMAGIAEAIQNFIEEFHWDNISEFVTNALQTIADGITTFFDGIDWGDLGSKLSDQLGKILSNKETWHKIGEALGAAIQAAVDFVSNFIKGLKADDVVSALTEMINGFFDRVDTEQLGETIANIINLAIDVAKGFWAENKDKLKEEGQKLLKGFFDNIDKEDLKETIKTILGVVLIGGIVKAIPELLAQGAPLLLRGLGSLLSKVFSGLGSLLSSLSAKIMPIVIPRLVYLMQQIGTFLSSTVGTVLSGVVAGIIAFFTGAEIGKKIGALIFPDDKDLYKHYSGIKGTFELLKDTVITLGERTGEHLSEAWNNVSEAGKTLAERTSEHFNNLKQNAETSVENVKTAMSTFKERTAEHINGIKAKLEEGGIEFNNLKTDVGTAVEGMKTSVQEKLENVKTKFGELATTVGEKKTDISNKIQEMKNKASKNFENMKSNAENLKTDWANKFNTIKGNIDNFKNNASTSFNNVKGVIDTFKTNAGSILNTVSGNVDTFKNNWTSKFNEIKSNAESFKSSIGTAFEGLKSTVVSAIQGIANGIKSPINSILGFIEKMVNGVIDGINSLGDKLGSFDFEVPDWVPGDLGGKKFELSVPKLSRISIPRLAQGAVIPPNKEFLAMLGDQKQGTNIETPLSTMMDAFRQVMRETGGNPGTTTIQIITPDKQKLAEYVVEGGRVTQMSTGRNIFELAGV